MTNYKEMLRLQSLGINNTRIAEACGCARSTVISTLQYATAKGLKWDSVHDWTEKEVAERLLPAVAAKQTYKMPDYEYVHREMQKSGVRLNLLWLEYCEQCRSVGELPYKSTQFNKYYADYVHKTKATMHLEHKPGDVIQVDWAGQTAHIVDTDTGEIIKEYLFVAVLPYSGYSYVEAFQDMGQENWIAAHVNAYRYFGGVTRILTQDNLKTGITKNTRDELVINRSYREMAEHYGTAIIPTRPRAPKDKAAVEGTVGVVSTFILAALRNQQFLSLRELNEAVWDRLYGFNHKPFQKKNGSRASAFEEEKLFLLPLPGHPFELATWRIATVQYNYHISVDTQNYSCPYEYIKQKVDVRMTRSTVEIFFDGNRIASHPRLYGRPNQYSTLEAHMPPDHQKYIQWNGERFISWAEKVGPNTTSVIRLFLNRYAVEQQGYKSCMALLKLTDKYPPQRLEAACSKAFSFTASPQVLKAYSPYCVQDRTNCPSRKWKNPPPLNTVLHAEPDIMTGGTIMLTENTVSKLHEMKLSVMAQSFREQMTNYEFVGLSFEDRFSLLVDSEWASRKSNRLNRLIRSAEYSIPDASVENIEYSPSRNLDKALISRLSSCAYVLEANNVIILGATGVGKTYLASALGMAANRSFYAVRYTRLPDLLAELAISRGDGTYRKVMKKYKQIKLLILDEYLLFPLKESEARDLLEIVEARHKVASTIFCSQFAVAGWYAKIGEPTLSDAICDRIVHNSYTIKIDGDSMRKRKSISE